MFTILKKLGILFFLLFAGCGPLFSDSLEEGRDLFRSRKLDDAVRILQAVKCSLPPQEKKEASLLLAKCYWTKACHYTGDSDTKFELFGKGLEEIEAALEEFGDEGSLCYWKAILTGEKANVRFTLESCGAAEVIDDLCHRVIGLDPSYENGGAYLALGRMYYKLPKLFGGGPGKSVQYLLSAKAYMEMIPPSERTHTVYLFLAESYIALRKYEEARLELMNGLRCRKNPDAPLEDEKDYEEMERLLAQLNDRDK